MYTVHEHCHIVRYARARGIGSVHENTPRCDFFFLSFYDPCAAQNVEKFTGRVQKRDDVVVSFAVRALTAVKI